MTSVSNPTITHRVSVPAGAPELIRAGGLQLLAGPDEAWHVALISGGPAGAQSQTEAAEVAERGHGVLWLSTDQLMRLSRGETIEVTREDDDRHLRYELAVEQSEG